MWDSQENLSEFDKFLIKTNKIGAKSLDEYKEKGFVEYVKSCHRSLQS